MKGWTENGRSSLPPWAKEQGLWFVLVRDCRIWRQEDSIHSTWATAPIPSFSAGISNQTQARSCKKIIYSTYIADSVPLPSGDSTNQSHISTGREYVYL